MSEQILDCIGVPEFFYTTVGKTEPAGGDCVRIFCCIERGGFLVPQVTVVMPARCIIEAVKVVQKAAMECFSVGTMAH